jgi:Uma2 family endonuclease
VTAIKPEHGVHQSHAYEEREQLMTPPAIPNPDHRLFTIDEYLALERTDEERHEYLDGCVYAMAGESPDHGRICTNLTRRLAEQLDGTGCEIFAKDTKVRCGPSPRPGQSMQGLFAYPDLVVVCGALQFHDQVQDVLLNPLVIVEVLSPSTEAFDRGEKFRRYRRWLPTLTDYVLVAQDRPVIDHYQRQEGDNWLLRTLEGLDARLELTSIACTVPLSQVYDRIVFAETGTET